MIEFKFCLEKRKVTNKDTWYGITIYAITISICNFAFTLVVVGILNLIFFIEKIELLDLEGFLSCYAIGYVVLFMLNISVLNDYLEKLKNKDKEIK
jgi:hypothetical protein